MKTAPNIDEIDRYNIPRHGRLEMYEDLDFMPKVIWHPDTVALLDPRLYDEVQGFTPMAHNGWDDPSGEGRLTAVGVANGVNASAGPIFEPDENGNTITLDQSVATAHVSTTVPTLTDGTVYTSEGSWSAPLDAVTRRLWQAGSLQLYTNNGVLFFWDSTAQKTSASTVQTLLGVGSWDRFWFRIVVSGTSLTVEVSADGAAWTSAISTTIVSYSISGVTLYTGSGSGSSPGKGRCHSLVVRDGGVSDDIVASLPVDPAAYDTLADGGVAEDAYGNEWEIERPTLDTTATRYMPARDEQYISLPGNSGEYVSSALTPDLSGGCFLWAHLGENAAPNGATIQQIVGAHWTGGKWGVRLRMSTTSFVVDVSPDGSATSSLDFKTPGEFPSYGQGSQWWIGAFVDPTANELVWYDGGTGSTPTWSDIETVSPGAFSIADGSSLGTPVTVGGRISGLDPLADDHYTAAGIGSSVTNWDDIERIDVADADPDSSTWTSPTSGATITLNKSASAQNHAKIVPANTCLFQGDGASQRLITVGDDSITDFDPAVGLTYIADFSFGSGAGSFGRLMSTGASAQSGILRNSTLERVYGRAYDGSTAVQIGDSVDNISYDTRTLFTAAFGDSDHESYVDGVSDETAATAVGSFASAGALTFFADPGGGGNIAADLYGAAVLRKRITTDDAVIVADEGILA